MSGDFSMSGDSNGETNLEPTTQSVFDPEASGESPSEGAPADNAGDSGLPQQTRLDLEIGPPSSRASSPP